MQRKTFDLAVTDFVQSIGLLVRRARAAAESHELSWAESAVLKHLVNLINHPPTRIGLR